MSQSHGRSRSRAALLGAAVVATVAGTGPAAALAFAAPVHAAWAAAMGSSAAPDQRLVGAVTLLCSVTLGATWGWLTATVLAEVLDRSVGARRAARRTIPPTWRPQVVRSLVALVLGSMVAVPATATAERRPVLPTALDGLRLPDRLPGRVVARPSTVRVHVGDTLWGIAAERLPAAAAPAVIDAVWRRIYGRNRAAVGPDPDLLVPGTLLRVPRSL